MRHRSALRKGAGADMSATPSNGEMRRNAEPKIEETVQRLIAEYGDPARLLELYYWSQQSSLIEVIRAVSALPSKTRARLHGFLTMASNPRLIECEPREDGGVFLSSPQAAEAMAMIRQAIAR